MDKILEKYILDYTSPEDEILNELYRKTYSTVVNPNMISGHLQGKVLSMLVSMISPKTVLEIGTYTGYSAIAIARYLQPGAVLHTIEINDELYDLSSSFIAKAGCKKNVKMHTGNAKDIIPDLNIEYDLAFIDGDKREYPEYLEIVLPYIKAGGHIIADNVLWDGKVVDPQVNDPMTKGIREFNELVKNNPQLEQVVISVRDGLMLIRKGSRCE